MTFCHLYLAKVSGVSNWWRAATEALKVSPAWLMFGVTVIEGLEQEAIETARAWSRLMEPQRTALKEMILRIAESGPESVQLPESGVLETSELLGLR